MNYNQELYREFRQRKESRNYVKNYTHTYKRRALLQKFIELPDSLNISLESSIPLLKSLGIITSIESVDHIVELMETKKRVTEGWQGGEKELWECRLIYFLWDVIGQDSLEMREFKELLLVLINNETERQQTLKELFGVRQEIGQLIQTWDHLFLQEIEGEEISDISIIKTKNDGIFGDSKENSDSNTNQNYKTQRNSSRLFQKKQTRSKSRNDKSYEKRTANSLGYISTKRTEPNSLANYISGGVQPVTFFKENDCLNPAEEKELVNRLYKCDIYKKREEAKKKIEEQKLKNELSSCTFKPLISHSHTQNTLKNSQRNIKGYQQAINRIKTGYQKKKQLQKNLEFRMWEEGPSLNGKPTIGYAPKFHIREPKQQKNELFQLKFTLGRLIIPVKIRESDKVPELVAKIGRIYSLKKYQKQYIYETILQALEQYSSLYEGPSEFDQQ